MKYPITLTFAIPILIIVSTLVGGDGRSVLVTIAVLGLLFLAEIRIKHGNITPSTIKQYFNTPIKPRGLFGEPPVDNSPKVSLLSGILIILLGTVLITIAIAIYFSLV